MIHSHMSNRRLLVVFFSPCTDDSEIYDEHRGLTYKDMMSRDVRRFAAADLDGDQRLTRDELADFLHPGQ